MTSPREHLRPVEYIYRMPGTERLYAVIRHVEVLDRERRVMVWRAVTHAEPRELIGYWPDLDTCVMKGAHAGDPGELHRAANRQLSDRVTRTTSDAGRIVVMKVTLRIREGDTSRELTVDAPSYDAGVALIEDQLPVGATKLAWLVEHGAGDAGVDS